MKTIPYAQGWHCFIALLEQLPIQFISLFRPRTRYLFCFCAAVETINGSTQFVEEDRMGSKLWADLRFEGYAEAIKHGLADKLVLFGPANETLHAEKVLKMHNVPADTIISTDTRVSTVGNSKVMRNFLWNHKIPIQWVRMSSSAYHVRASIFAFEGCLVVRHMPAEVFLFAGTNASGKEDVRNRLVHEFGDSDLTRRFVWEIQGIWDRIYGEYDLPEGG